MATKTFHGSCQCGAIKFEADIDLAKGTNKCNCTSCFKRRWWSVKVAPEAFRKVAGDDKRTGPKGGCVECGIIPYGFVDKSDWNDTAYWGVNVATLDDVDFTELADSPVTFMDGRADNWWQPPAETRHL